MTLFSTSLLSGEAARLRLLRFAESLRVINTSLSLLERLQQPKELAAWERFVQLYTPLLAMWARRLGLLDQDADDLIQDVFTVLVQKLPDFRYDPGQRFRGWLWTVTVNKFRERRRRQPARAPSGAPLPEEVVPDIAEVISEAEYREYLGRRALKLMRAEFQPATWQAFWECVINERSAADVARDLGMTENAVYLAKGRVLRRLRRDLDGLLD